MNETTVRIEALASAAIEVEQTSPTSWDRPSNLADWSVRDLVGHATGSAQKILTLIEDGELWGPSEPADWVCGTLPRGCASWPRGYLRR